MLATQDLIIIAAYFIIVNIIGSWKRKGSSVNDYLLNSRNTSFLLLTCSTVATIAGAGTVVGVSAEAGRTGISFGIITLVALLANMAMYTWLVPRIRSACDSDGVRTPSDLMRNRYGLGSQWCLSVAYVGIAVIWTAVQFLAISNLLSSVFGWSVTEALFVSYAAIVIYTSIGGLFSDIASDFIEFWIKLGIMVFLIPLFLQNNLPAVRALPPTYFNPTAYGGISLLIGSALIGCLYPLAQAHDWMRINSAKTTRDARRCYLYAFPLVGAFVIAATFLGLVGATHGMAGDKDALMFHLFEKFLPTGIKGLAYAGILAVVMSSVNSIMLGGAATLHSLFISKTDERRRVRELRILVACFGAVSVLAAGIYPKLVELAILATFGSLCLGPVIIFGLFNKKLPDRLGILSLTLGIGSLGVGILYLGKMAFLAGLLGAMLPVLGWRCRCKIK